MQSSIDYLLPRNKNLEIRQPYKKIRNGTFIAIRLLKLKDNLEIWLTH